VWARKHDQLHLQGNAQEGVKHQAWAQMLSPTKPPLTSQSRSDLLAKHWALAMVPSTEQRQAIALQDVTAVY
jgi:hypothetical protein